MLSLDTHILVFALSGDLSLREQSLLSDQLWSVSAIVLWELAKLTSLGRIDLDLDSQEFSQLLSRVRIWPLDFAVCKQTMALDFRSDPADEIIAATSIVHRVPLLTRDRKLRNSKLIPLA